jgi:hypothetical protein
MTEERKAQKLLMDAIIDLKISYRKFRSNERSVDDEIKYLKRSIKKNEKDPFYAHRIKQWSNKINQLEVWHDEFREHKHRCQEMLIDMVRAIDEIGVLSVHEYAALLSTSHIHVRRLIDSGDAKNLMDLIVYHAEDSANKSDWISDDCILAHCLRWVTFRAIQSNKKLREEASNMLHQWFIESTGRPLAMYQSTTFPNGEQVMTRVPPKLNIVK